MEEWIEIEARVDAHVPGAMTDEFEDGSFVHYDATELELLRPADLRGRALTIFHDRPVAADSPWRRPGARIRARLLAESLAGDRQVFDGAVRDLEVVTEREGGPAGVES